MKLKTAWLIPGLCVIAPLAIFVLFTVVFPRPYYIFTTDIEPDYYYNARLVLDGKPTGLHHPGTLIYYLAAIVLKLAGTELAQTQHFLNICYFIVALASIGGLLVFWRCLLRNLPTGIAVAVLVLVLAWPCWMEYSNYFGADSFTVAIGLPISALLWRLFALSQPPSVRTLVLTGAALGFALAIKLTFAPFAAAALGGIFVGQLLQPTLAWSGINGRIWQAIRKAALLTFGLGAAFILGVTPAWSKAVAIWYKTFQRPDTHTAGMGARSALSHSAHLIFEANPLLAVFFAMVTGWFLLTGVRLLRPKIDQADTARENNPFDVHSAAAFLGLLLLSFIYCATTVPDYEGDPAVSLRNLAPGALFFPLALVFCVQLAPADSTGKTWFAGKSRVLAVVAAATLLVGVYLENRSRMNFVEDRTREITAVKTGLQAYEIPGSRIAFWTSSGENYLGEASFHFWGNYHYGNKLYYPLLQKEFPQLTFFQLRNAARIFVDANTPANSSAKKPASGLKASWAKIKDVLFSLDLPSPLDGGYFYEGDESEKPGLIAFTSSQMDDPSVKPLTLEGLEKILAQSYGKVDVSRVKFGDTEWLLFKPAPQRPAN